MREVLRKLHFNRVAHGACTLNPSFCRESAERIVDVDRLAVSSFYYVAYNAVACDVFFYIAHVIDKAHARAVLVSVERTRRLVANERVDRGCVDIVAR